MGHAQSIQAAQLLTDRTYTSHPQGKFEQILGNGAYWFIHFSFGGCVVVRDINGTV
jgi:hypothetical protein